MSKYVFVTEDGNSHEVDTLENVQEVIVRLFELKVVNDIEAYYEVDVTQ